MQKEARGLQIFLLGAQESFLLLKQDQ
ncbi:hypothetical protein LNTAR_11411 [Lentisphaera araneosa HTCC2155]|uniref:Uncharacterized protein n=1 Tax=Lentisphaera araneosa HTCC2155 TaxID=313628 RepID=A6DJ85_9BACT|nr:hypothetical protein LNTAR_11411 [Lentisphaera araneosa HTCC2155]